MRFTNEELERFAGVVTEAVQFYPSVRAGSMFKDLLGAIVYLNERTQTDNERIKQQARTIMDLPAQLDRDPEYDPLGRGAIVELISDYPANVGTFPGGTVGVVHNPRYFYDDPKDTIVYVGVRFPGFMETYKVSTAILRIIRRPEHAG